MMGGRELLFSGIAISSTSEGVALTFSILIALFFFAELIIFPLFVSALAKSVRARWALGACIGLIVFAAVIALFQLVSIILFFVFAKSQTFPPPKGLLVTSVILSLISFLALAGQMIWYTLVLFRVRGQIE
jgi:hypothetical protein